MTNAVIECILSRSAAKYYDPAATLSDDQIRELVRIGTTAPTSFHLQNWRFVAVRTPEAKARLRPIAWDQPAITEAAVTFIVCGQFPGRTAPMDNSITGISSLESLNSRCTASASKPIIGVEPKPSERAA